MKNIDDKDILNEVLGRLITTEAKINAIKECLISKEIIEEEEYEVFFQDEYYSLIERIRN